MIEFHFTARCGDETLPISVSLEYQPGNQTQQARRKAVGELLVALKADEAQIDARLDGLVTVVVGDARWVIAEARGTGNTERRI